MAATDAGELKPALLQRELTPVERTAVGVCWFRWKGQQELKRQLFDAACDRALLDACFASLPRDTVEQWSGWALREDGLSMMQIRTVSLDDALLHATGAHTAQPVPAPWTGITQAGDAEDTDTRTLLSTPGSIRQVVICAAGLDPRAWRLAWPAGTTVWEVDTGALESLKSHVLGPLPLTCAARHALVADLRDLPQLEAQLKGAGFDPAEPTVWLLEGLIGYLTVPEGDQLLAGLLALSAPGSRLVVTAPPTPELFEERRAAGNPLLHLSPQPATDTLARVKASGWRAALVGEVDLAALYGLPCRQAQLHGIKVAA